MNCPSNEASPLSEPATAGICCFRSSTCTKKHFVLARCCARDARPHTNAESLRVSWLSSYSVNLFCAKRRTNLKAPVSFSAQSYESGGHGASHATTFCLVPEAVDFVRERCEKAGRPPVPVVAAGGVTDSRQVSVFTLRHNSCFQQTHYLSCYPIMRTAVDGPRRGSEHGRGVRAAVWKRPDDR